MSYNWQDGEELASDKLNLTGVAYLVDTGAADAYAANPQVEDNTGTNNAFSAYSTGMVFVFKAGNTNTGPSTLNINSIGAVSIVKGLDEPLDAGDIVQDQMVTVIYDGTNFQLIKTAKALQTVFGGDGSDGDLSISSGTTNVDCNGDNIVVLNYESISITGTGKLTFSNPASDGTIVIMKCQRDAVITSSTTPCIDLTGIGAAGGAINGGDGTNAFAILDENDHFGEGGIMNGDSVGGTQVDDQRFYTIDENYLLRGINITPGSGGGGGARDTSSTGGQNPSGGAGAGSLYSAGADGNEGNNGSAPAGNSAGGSGGADETGSGSGSMTAGVGGNGGGALLMQVQGALNFTGEIWAKGQDGEDGAASGTATASGGGGGSAGMVVILYNFLTSAAGTIDTSGGAGGDSSAGGTGGAGGGNAGGIVAKNNFFA